MFLSITSLAVPLATLFSCLLVLVFLFYIQKIVDLKRVSLSFRNIKM